MKTVKSHIFKPIAVLLTFVLLLGSVPSAFAYSSNGIETLGGSYFITDRGDLWVWGDSENSQLGEADEILTMTRRSGTYSSFTVNGSVGNYVTSAGKLYRWGNSDTPFHMYDTVSGKLINANDESQCLMTGVDKAVGGDESSIFVLKENGDLWVIPYTAGKPYKALTDVTDVIPANPEKPNEIVYALTKDRKVYRIENLLYVSKATVTRIASKVNAEALVDITSTELLFLIDSSDELIEYNISRNGYNTIMQNVKSASVGYTSGDVYAVTSDGTVTMNSNVISPDGETFTAVAAHQSGKGCTAVDKNGNVWAYGKSVPAELYHYKDCMVKIFDGSPVTVNLPKLSIKISDTNITIDKVDTAVEYYINGERQQGTDNGTTITFTGIELTGSKVFAAAVDTDGNTVAANEIEYTKPADEQTKETTIERKGTQTQIHSLGQALTDDIQINAPEQVRAGVRILKGYQQVYDSGYVYCGADISITSLAYTPDTAGMYTVIVYAFGSDGIVKTLTYSVIVIDDYYSGWNQNPTTAVASFTVKQNDNGVYTIISPYMYSQYTYVVSDNATDQFYYTDENGSEILLGTGYAVIPSGITQFTVKSSGVSVLAFGLGSRFINYMYGDNSVSYLEANPVYSMFTNTQTAVNAVQINTVADLFANIDYITQLSMKTALTAYEKQLAQKVIALSQMSGISTNMLLSTTIERLTRLVGGGTSFSESYSYDGVKTADRIPRDITISGLNLTENEAEALTLKFVQHNADYVKCEFTLNLWDGDVEYSTDGTMTVSFTMPSSYIHSSNNKICYVTENGEAEWLTFTYDMESGRASFRTDKFGTFAVVGYNKRNSDSFKEWLDGHLPEQFTVTFKDWNGDIISEQKVTSGMSAEVPEAPTRDGFMFIWWDKSCNEITADTVITAVYEEVEFVSSFADIKGHWAEQYVTELERDGILKNLFTDSFNPDVNMTRGLYITLAARIVGESEQWMYDNNIIMGYGNGYYGLADTITREQVAVITQRILTKLDVQLPTQNHSKAPYIDMSNVSTWAIDAVERAYGTAYMIGDNANRFNPQNTITNAETVTLLCRISEHIAEK